MSAGFRYLLLAPLDHRYDLLTAMLHHQYDLALPRESR